MMELKVGFIGLGTMGGAMCGHLIDGGVPTSVWARKQEKAQVLLASGAEWAAAPKRSQKYAMSCCCACPTMMR